MDESGNGIPGASVAVKGSTRGVTTDVDGSFEFEVSESEVLEFSYLGYQTQEIRVGSAYQCYRTAQTADLGIGNRDYRSLRKTA